MGPKRQTRNKGKGKMPLVIPADDTTDASDVDVSGLMKGAGILDLGNLSSINEIEQADDSKMKLEEEGFEGEDDSQDDDADSLDEWMEQDDDDDDDEQDEIVDDDEITTLLNQSAEQRSKLKTGDLDEFQREMEEFDNNLALTSGIGLNRVKRSTKKRITAGELRLSDEVKQVLGQANGLYIQKDYGSAVDLLQKVIKENPQAYPAWNTLGLVHEELGNTEKSLQFRMTAALLTNDNDLWKELAQKSIECNAISQAIHCFSKVINNDPNDVDAIWDRAFLYKQMDDVTKAIRGFQTILKHYPHHFKVINELAQLYRTQGKTREAIQMYEDAIIWHTNNAEENEDDEDEDGEEEDAFKNKLGYSEINMLSELYLILNDYKKALNTIKTGLRLVQKRQNETWWVDRDDDDEYLEEDESRTEFPIELRVRMGVCRVYMNQVRLGTEHFKYLLQYPATTYPDLHQDIAYAYYDKRHFDLALQVFQKIIDVSDEVQTDIIIKAGDCFREVGHLDTAVQFYKNVLEEQNDNVDVLMSLAAVYEEQGKEDEALQLVDYVMEQGRKARRQKKSDQDKDGDHDQSTAKDKFNEMKENRKKRAKTVSSSIFDETANLSRTEFYRQRRAADRRMDEDKTVATHSIFKQLDEQDAELGPNLRVADRGLMRDYMRNVQELFEDFTTISAFYPAIKSQRYTGFYALRRGRKTYKYDLNIGMEAHNMANRLRKVKVKSEDGSTTLADAAPEDMDDDEAQMHREEEERNRQLVLATQFRGISFDKWLYVFLRYAYILAVSRRIEDAYEVLKKLSHANVFYQNVEKKTAIRLAMIGCGVIGKNETVIQLGARWLCNYYRFQSDPYRLFMSVISEGLTDTVAYASYNQLRYLMRNIRLMDAIVTNTRKTLEGSNDNAAALEEIRELNEAILAMNVDPSTANEQNYSRFYDIPKESDMISNNTERTSIANPTHLNPVLLTVFGSIVSLTKSVLASSLFFLRSYALAPKDRLNTLSLGLSLLHAAITRKSDNRHLQIMQGMLFIFEYAKLSKYNQEAEYNIGRAFHLLGLTHLAVPHYEKALSMRQAADGTIEHRPVEDVYKWPVSEQEEEELEQDMDDEYDLKSEAAYNLHLIYITSGSVSLAQILMLKYCSV